MKKITEEEFNRAMEICNSGVVPAKEFDITLQYSAQQMGFETWSDYLKHQVENWEPFCATSLKYTYGKNYENNMD